ncbi:hypothetical protein N657DRAFT_581997 [Parathielavia appendiculata]|uniref:Uncharacterized protein n=1 Tax=Parathielavia appendiculata TaxID=2587402 RepID=A0AAN6TR96_9PEZI|nr:hypothetical protein N657DRAFT_581997 [Parathielavia appendiculata]
MIGIGVGDIIKLTEHAWALYKGYKESSADFAQLATELQSLYVVLAEISDFMRENDHDDGDNGGENVLEASRRNRLSILTDGCRDLLRDMEALYVRYESLGTRQQRTWDRTKWATQEGHVSQLRGRLVSSTTLLTAWNVAVINSSTARINKRLDKYIAEVRAGLREGSVVTAPDAAQSIESPDVWSELRRELEDIGISAAVIEEKKEYILSWFRQQLAESGLDEACDEALTLASWSPEMGVQAAAPLWSDSGYGGSETWSSTRGSISQESSLTVANQAFEEELKRHRIEWPPDEGGTLRQTTTSSTGTVSVKARKRSTPIGMIRKLFKNDTEIVQAASDGDVEKVAKLISLGMDVNARDRWGWSALSMCGYGGYKDIARLLLDHGADLDNEDVDGDTPTSLAAQRGHTELVLLFDREREAKDQRVREMDKEVPRRSVPLCLVELLLANNCRWGHRVAT